MHNTCAYCYCAAQGPAHDYDGGECGDKASEGHINATFDEAMDQRGSPFQRKFERRLEHFEEQHSCDTPVEED